MNSMLPWFPRSLFGAVLATVYCLVAIAAVMSDRRSTGGGWITLHGMASFLITLPVSLLGEWSGCKPDYRRNLDMGFAILICTTLIYFLGAGLGRLARMLFSAGNPG